MLCPECRSTHVRKNGKRRGKQNHICVACRRQFIDHYTPLQGYSEAVKWECLSLSVNGMGFRAIERVKGVHHTTVIYWLKQVGRDCRMLMIQRQHRQWENLMNLKPLLAQKKQDLALDSR